MESEGKNMLWIGIGAALLIGNLMSVRVDDVTLRITVVNEVGVVVPDVPICAVGHTPHKRPFAGCGWTDGAGTVDIHLPRSVDGYVFGLSSSMTPSPVSNVSGNARYKQLLCEYAEPGDVWVDDLAGQAVISKTLSLAKSTVVKGTAVGPSGAREHTFISVMDSHVVCESSKVDGRFELRGVPVNQSVLLAVVGCQSFSVFKYLEVFVPPGVEDFEVGEIACETTGGDAGKVSIRSSGAVGVHEQAMYGCCERVTLVQDDGSRGIRSPTLPWGGGVSGEFGVPAGTYFVVPGTAHGNRLVAKLVGLLKAGCATDVAASGAFPRVTVTKDSHDIVEIEWRTAIDRSVAYLGGR